ncbi:hypothetical protein DLAC_00408 [Tieghemostelium lacteum]|uniref:Cathepsin propeptide inhibitor domain-containing protein n=1 Tax=Tieghemostelium lacteum TaxID=361077 RepID=A0A152A9N0_TIELA|nr:hypothetical protein DLAC_00408 [Tieghemostelium lacteum]|eukprot:KYR02928.1 hypothetical protein DLAC_00408 [Tieghemostelium lacteum]
MKSIIFVFLIVLLVLVSNIQSISDKEYWDSFGNWRSCYGKNYDSSEIQEKFKNYKDNCEKINQNNEKYCDTPSFDAIIDISDSSLNIKLLNTLDIAMEQVISVSLPTSSVPIQSLNEFSDMSYYEFVSTYTGAEPAESAAVAVGTAGSVLSSAAIVGISLAGCAIVASAVSTGIYIHKKNKKKQEEEEKKKEEKQVEEMKKYLENISAVNLFDMTPGSHKSITGRGVPIPLQ